LLSAFTLLVGQQEALPKITVAGHLLIIYLHQGYVLVGLGVCKIQYVKHYEQSVMKFCRETERGPEENQLDFGCDPDSFLDL